MKKKYSKVVLRIISIMLVFIFVCQISISVQATPVVQNVNGLTVKNELVYSRNSGEQEIDPNLKINGSGYLSKATVKITENYNSNTDSLKCTYDSDNSWWYGWGLDRNFDTSTGVFTISGWATIGTYQAILRSMKFVSTADTGSRKIVFSIGEVDSSRTDAQPSIDGQVYYYPGTGHYYQFFRNYMDHHYFYGSDMGFITGKTAASMATAKSFNGYNGYLATVTSQGENDFLFSLVPSGYAGWISGTSADTPGVWRYDSGPEEGIQFSAEQESINGRYTNWNSGTTDSDKDNYIILGADNSSFWKATSEDPSMYNVGFFVEYGVNPIEKEMSGTVDVAIEDIPSSPSAVSVLPQNEALNVGWNAPMTSGGGTLLGYDIYANGVKKNTEIITGNAYKITGLENGTKYEITVTAVNGAGESLPSESVQGIPYTVPDKVDAPSVARGDGKLTVRWTVPFDGGSAITGYNVYLDGKKHNTTPIVTKPEYVIENLSNFQSHAINVSAINIAGEGEKSGETVKAASVKGEESSYIISSKGQYNPSTEKLSVDVILKYAKADAGAWGLSFDTDILRNGMFTKSNNIDSIEENELSYSVHDGYHTFRWYAINGAVDGTGQDGIKLGTYTFDISQDDYEKKLCYNSIEVKKWTETSEFTGLGGDDTALNNEIWSATESRYNIIPVADSTQSVALPEPVYTLFDYDNGDKSVVTFDISNAVDSNKIQGATISVTGEATATMTTNGNGVTYNAFKNGSYNYTITATGYATKTGTFRVSNINKSVKEKLFNKYRVDWNIANGKIEDEEKGESTVTHGEAYSFQITANEGRNMVAPNVMVGGRILSSSEFTFSSETGIGTIPANVVTGNIIISAILTIKTYKVTATSGDNGSVQKDYEYAQTGTVEQTGIEHGSNSTQFIFKANEGFEIDKVKVDGEEQSVSDNSLEYVYTFPSVTAAGSIEVTFKEFKGTVTFNVTDVNTGNPIENASIRIEKYDYCWYDINPDITVITLKTDSQGRASSDEIANSSYGYTITKSGYATYGGMFGMYNQNQNIDISLDTKYPVNWYVNNGTINDLSYNWDTKANIGENYTFQIKANEGYAMDYFSTYIWDLREKPMLRIGWEDYTDSPKYTFDKTTGIATIDKSLIIGYVYINADLAKQKFMVRATSGQNGTVTKGSGNATTGDVNEQVEYGNNSSQFVFNAKSGYEIASVKINGEPHAIAEDITSYTYTAEAVKEAKTIVVTYKVLTYKVQGLVNYVKRSIASTSDKGTVKFKKSTGATVLADFVQDKTQGRFIAELEPGTYTLEVSKDGYTKYEITGIPIISSTITLPHDINLVAGDATWDKELISMLDISTIVSGVRNASIKRADIDEDTYNSVIDVGYAKSNYSKTNVLKTWTQFIN